LASNVKLHFARFEFKFVLNQALREAVESELGHFVEFDPFVAGLEGHKYPVRSLYFDDPFYTAFFDKIDGLHTRWKFRLRTYTFDAHGEVPRFLEKKGRYNNLVFKHRVLVNSATDLRGEALSRQILSSGEQGKVLDQFHYELFRKQLRPVALVDYYRRPYISKFDPEFRLTFDDSLRGTATSGAFPRANETSRRLLPGYTVMEVKFRYHIPAWFHHIIQAYELQRVSVSKVVVAIGALGLAPNLS